MSATCHAKYNLSNLRSQHGAVFIVMLVVLVMGAATVLVSSFTKATLQIERDKQTTEALAQAKEALIGRAVTDANMPGSLPCPDVNDDGSSDDDSSDGSGGICKSNIGRLPWRTLGLPDLRDSTGERLWFALSPNFRDDSSSRPLNSESMGMLNVTGSQTASNVIAIVFSAGAVVDGQSRSATVSATCSSLPPSLLPALQSNCPTNYLEGTNSTLSTAASPNLNYQSSDTAVPFNDRLLIIVSDQLWPAVEMRIAREARNCLDEYADANSNRYPWAAAPTDVTQYLSMNNTLFGRLPAKAKVDDSGVTHMIQAMNALQAAVNACVISDNWTNRHALDDAGAQLQDAAQSVKDHSANLYDTAANYAVTAGDKAQDSGRCGNINDHPTTNSVQTNLNNANSALNSALPSVWGTSPPVSCAALTQTYWNDWRNLVFYQVDARYHPNGPGGTPSLTINGTGNYRATVIVARRPLATQTRVTTDPTTYLEGTNRHYPILDTKFKSNAVGDANFQTVNDLVLCLDGKLNCK